MDLQQQDRFYQMMTRLKTNSRAASTQTKAKEDTMITEVHDGIIVTRPAKKYEEIIESKAATTNEAQAKVWNLTKDGPVLQSKAASVPVNKLQEIIRFQRSNGRL